MYICLGKALNFDTFYCKKAKSYQGQGGLMVRTPGFHPEDPGSIPHAGDFFKILILIHIFNLVPIV